MHCTHSILADGWIQTLRQENPWVYIVSQELAPRVWLLPRYSSPTLKELCERGILQRLPYKRWPTDIFSYTIDFEKLQQELGRSPQVENQTADSQNSECPESESQPPSPKSEHLHRYNPNPSLSPPQTTTDVQKTRWM